MIEWAFGFTTGFVAGAGFVGWGWFRHARNRIAQLRDTLELREQMATVAGSATSYDVFKKYYPNQIHQPGGTSYPITTTGVYTSV